MRTFFRFTLFGILLILSAVFLSACGGSDGSDQTTPGMQVGIKDSLCPSISVKVGDQVTWRNEGNLEHEVMITAADGSTMFDSGALIRGDIASFTFTEAGTYEYSCLADQSLKGTITVEQ